MWAKLQLILPSKQMVRLRSYCPTGMGEKSPFPFYFNMLSSYTYSMYAPQEIS